MPSTKVLVAIARILKDEGYIGDFEVIEKTPAERAEDHPALRRRQAACDSRDQAGQQAGLRVYAGKDAIPRVQAAVSASPSSAPRRAC